MAGPHAPHIAGARRRFLNAPAASLAAAAGLLMVALSLLERPAVAQTTPGCCEQADFELLRAQVDELLARGLGLESKIAIESSVLRREEQVGAALAYETLRSVREQVARAVLATVPARAPLDRHLAVVLRELHQRGIRAAGSAGSNALFVDLFARTLEHGVANPPILIDCDAAVLTVYVMFEEMARLAPDRSLFERLRAAAYASHMALIEVDPRGRMRVVDLNGPAGADGAPLLAWRRAASYDEAYRALRGESMVLLAGWPQLLANTWELAAGRLLARRDPLGAHRYAEQALRLSPGSVGAANNLGVALTHLGRGAEALAVLRAASQRSDEPLLLANLAGALLQVGEWQQASAAAERAISRQPRLAIAYYRRHVARWRLGDQRGSQHDFERFRLLVARAPARAPAAPSGEAPATLLLAQQDHP